MKNVLALVASRLFGAKNRPEPLPSAQPAANPLSESAPAWTDDTVLRRLADTYTAGLSKWVLAGDLAEFYEKFDSRKKAGLNIEVRQDVADKIAKWMTARLHIEKPDNDIATAIGPTYIAGVRLMAGDRKLADLSWVYDVIDSWFDFKFKDHNGAEQTRRFQCGMDFADFADSWGTPAPAQLDAPKP